MAKFDEKTFEQAVALAAAFVANGNISLGGSLRSDSLGLAMLADAIPEIYQVVADAKEMLQKNGA